MMRLLNVHSLTFRTFTSAITPRYAIASHRWIEATETSMEDIRKRRNTRRLGYRKVKGFAQYVKNNLIGIDWMWIDTCCINQESSQEVSEAINSMFRYYRDAYACLVFLSDVSVAEDLSEFRQSSWFQRGWTLQELIAPSTVIFLTNSWQTIGRKACNGSSSSKYSQSMDRPLEPVIADITGIPSKVLNGEWHCGTFYESAEAVFRWMSSRKTTREEDSSYCLFGLLDVSLPIIYGEGEAKARERLHTELSRSKSATSSLITKRSFEQTDDEQSMVTEVSHVELRSCANSLIARPMSWPMSYAETRRLKKNRSPLSRFFQWRGSHDYDLSGTKMQTPSYSLHQLPMTQTIKSDYPTVPLLDRNYSGTQTISTTAWLGTREFEGMIFNVTSIVSCHSIDPAIEVDLRHLSRHGHPT